MPRTIEDYQSDVEDFAPNENVTTLRPQTEERNVAGDRLRSFVERVERIDEELEALKEDRKAILSEAASQGFDKKILQDVVKYRKNPHDNAERLALFQTYCRNLGIQLDLDL